MMMLNIHVYEAHCIHCLLAVRVFPQLQWLNAHAHPIGGSYDAMPVEFGSELLL